MQGGFCVVIPMYNEENGAEKCVRSVCAALRAIPSRNTLLTVNDGSKDGTREVLDRLSPEFSNLKVVHHEKNAGYGAALCTGAKHAAEGGYEYVLFMDSDLTNSPDDLPKFVDKMGLGYDVIKATRYSAGGGVSDVPRYRVIISQAGNALARLLFRLPIHDCTNGFRAVRTALLCQMKLSENRFPIIMEELYWSKYLASRFAEVPVILRDRHSELRRTAFSYRPSVFWNYLKYPLRAFFGLKPQGFSAAARNYENAKRPAAGIPPKS
jgi:dolichol-phosphate mannosyltransferase